VLHLKRYKLVQIASDSEHGESSRHVSVRFAKIKAKMKIDRYLKLNRVEQSSLLVNQSQNETTFELSEKLNINANQSEHTRLLTNGSADHAESSSLFNEFSEIKSNLKLKKQNELDMDLFSKVSAYENHSSRSNSPLVDLNLSIANDDATMSNFEYNSVSTRSPRRLSFDSNHKHIPINDINKKEKKELDLACALSQSMYDTYAERCMGEYGDISSSIGDNCDYDDDDIILLDLKPPPLKGLKGGSALRHRLEEDNSCNEKNNKNKATYFDTNKEKCYIRTVFSRCNNLNYFS
jgi:hypothetical protein